MPKEIKIKKHIKIKKDQNCNKPIIIIFNPGNVFLEI